MDFNTILHTAPFIYLGCNPDTSTLIILWTYMGCVIAVKLINKLLGNTYIKSLPQLHYSWFYFYFNMYIFGGLRSLWHLTPGQHIMQ